MCVCVLTALERLASLGLTWYLGNEAVPQANALGQHSGGSADAAPRRFAGNHNATAAAHHAANQGSLLGGFIKSTWPQGALTADGPFWALADGNRMLQPLGYIGSKR